MWCHLLRCSLGGALTQHCSYTSIIKKQKTKNSMTRNHLSLQSALTNEWRHQGSPGLTRRPLNKSRGPETSTPARSCNKSNRKGLLTSTRQSKSVTESSGRVYDRKSIVNFFPFCKFCNRICENQTLSSTCMCLTSKKCEIQCVISENLYSFGRDYTHLFDITSRLKQFCL